MLLHRERFAKELEDEMQLHLELRRQQQEESGVAPKDARAAAYRRFGNPTLVRERRSAGPELDADLRLGLQSGLLDFFDEPEPSRPWAR